MIAFVVIRRRRGDAHSCCVEILVNFHKIIERRGMMVIVAIR